MLTRLRKSTQVLRPSSPSKHALPQAHDNASAACMTTITTVTDEVGPSQDRGRTFSGLSSFANLYPGSAKVKRNGNKREVKSSIMTLFSSDPATTGLDSTLPLTPSVSSPAGVRTAISSDEDEMLIGLGQISFLFCCCITLTVW